MSDTRAQALTESVVDHIGVGLWRASTAFVDEMYRRAGDRGFADLSPADGTILAFLPPKGLTITDLARRRGATKQATHEAVRKLAGRGILDVLADQEDKRARRVCFTARGLDFVAALQDIKAEMHQEAAGALGEDGLATLDTALSVLADLYRPPG